MCVCVITCAALYVTFCMHDCVCVRAAHAVLIVTFVYHKHRRQMLWALTLLWIALFNFTERWHSRTLQLNCSPPVCCLVLPSLWEPGFVFWSCLFLYKRPFWLLFASLIWHLMCVELEKLLHLIAVHTYIPLQKY